MDTDLNKETEFRVFFRENIVPSRLYRSVFPSYFLHRWICMQNTNDHRGRARKWSTVATELDYFYVFFLHESLGRR